MTFDEFYKKYNGKHVDYDGVCGNQCVDLAKVYLNKIFGLKPGAWGNAVDYYIGFNNHNSLVNSFDKIANNPTFVPLKGDIVIWGTKIGKYGHIAICTGSGNASWFESFDQNWPNGSKCKKVKHTYTGVLGFLRPKVRGKLFDYPSIKNGKTITLNCIRGIYKGAGASTGRKRVSDLTVDGKKNAVSTVANYNAYLKKGSKVTVLETKKLKNNNLWARIPSGWLCLYEFETATKRYK